MYSKFRLTIVFLCAGLLQSRLLRPLPSPAGAIIGDQMCVAGGA